MTDTVTAKLAEWGALTEAATEGPSHTGPDDDIRAQGDEYESGMDASCNRDSCWLGSGHDGECEPGGCAHVGRGGR